MKTRALSRQHDLKTFARRIGDDPWTVDVGQDGGRHVIADHALGGAFSLGVQLVQLDVCPASVVQQQLDRRGVALRFQTLLVGTGGNPAGRTIAVWPEDDIVGFAVRPQQQPKLRKTIGELHAINVVTARTDAAKEDRPYRAECLEH